MTFFPILKKNPNLQKKKNFFFFFGGGGGVVGGGLHTHTSYMMTILATIASYFSFNLMAIVYMDLNAR